MRTISLIILHCSGTRPGQCASAKEIDKYHHSLGWKCIGYHYVVRCDGTIEKGRPEDKVGAHCYGHNRHSIGICYEGGADANGMPEDTRTEEQKRSLKALVEELKTRYPRALVLGHNHFNRYKACPCFDAAKEYGEGK